MKNGKMWVNELSGVHKGNDEIGVADCSAADNILDEDGEIKDGRVSNDEAEDVKLESDKEENVNKAVVVYKAPKPELKRSKILESFNVLTKGRSSDEDRNNGLFNIILKLKEKGDEMKSSNLLSYLPTANERINKLTLQLVSKQTEIEKSKQKQ
jgi:hypothetical protein